ncbi:hypothetical protein [Labilibacter marinus]|uniref:hypothetical protein n=1 Tax=Labilibacter marinus TaxID=1477105 RepID=UPI00117B54E7|nr:hypothetical protein [Labilibacter marinus]
MNKFFITLIFLIASFSVMGQISKQEKLERIKAQKVAFITNRLELSSAEAQEFWPVYNEFFRKKEKLNNDKKAASRELYQNWKSYSEDEKTQLLDELIAFRLKEATLGQEYHTKLKEVLSIDKLMKLYNVENQFKTFLLKQIKGQGSRDINPSNRNFQRK